MNQYKLFVQRIGLIGFTQVLTSLSSIILLPLLTKNISIKDYGIWAQISVTIGMIPGLVMLGLPYTMVRYLPALKEKEKIREIVYSIFFVVIFTSSITSLLMYSFSEQIALRLFDNNVIIVKLLSLVVFFECLNNLLLNYLRATEQIKKYSLVLFISTALQTLIIILFVLRNKGILGAIIGLLITDVIVFSITAYNVILEIGIQKPLFKNIKEYLNFGIPTISGNFSNWVVNSSDRYVIGILLGTAAVGYYSPGYALGNLISIFVAPLSFLLPSILSKMYDENNIEEVKKVLSYSFKYLMAIAIPATFGISFLSKSILTILSTSEIASQGYMITPFTALSALLFGIYTIIFQVIVLEKKTTIIGKIWIISALLNLGLNFIFVPHFGILGAAFTTLIAFGFSTYITTYYAYKTLKFDIKFTFLLKSILSSSFISLIIIVFNPIHLYSIITTICICAITYFLILYLLKGFENKEIEFFKSMINLKRRSLVNN